MRIVYVAFIATFIAYLGFHYAAMKRRHKACQEAGHLWQSPGMGDNPNIQYICGRCFKEV